MCERCLHSLERVSPRLYLLMRYVLRLRKRDTNFEREEKGTMDKEEWRNNEMKEREQEKHRDTHDSQLTCCIFLD